MQTFTWVLPRYKYGLQNDSLYSIWKNKKSCELNGSKRLVNFIKGRLNAKDIANFSSCEIKDQGRIFSLVGTKNVLSPQIRISRHASCCWVCIWIKYFVREMSIDSQHGMFVYISTWLQLADYTTQWDINLQNARSLRVEIATEMCTYKEQQMHMSEDIPTESITT